MEKTEGTPFFIEEVVRTLIDSDEHWRATAAIENIAIPDSLQALLISRIDRLEDEAKRTLQVASVIGSSFYDQVLKRVSDEAVALDRQLSTLQRVDLIREAARVPDVEFMFRHELTRQAAYDSILRRRRPEFHRQVGEAMEEIFVDRLDEEAHRLAYHFGEAPRRRTYAQVFALRGRAPLLQRRSRASLRQGAGDRRSAGEEQHFIADLETKRGRTLELASRLDEAMASYEALGSPGVRAATRSWNSRA